MTDWGTPTYEPVEDGGKQNQWGNPVYKPLGTEQPAPTLDLKPYDNMIDSLNSSDRLMGIEDFQAFDKENPKTKMLMEHLPDIGAMLPGYHSLWGAPAGQAIHDMVYPPAAQGSFAATPPEQWPGHMTEMFNSPYEGYPPPRPVEALSGEQGMSSPFWDAEFERLNRAGALGAMTFLGGKALGLGGQYLSPKLAGEFGSDLPKLVTGEHPFAEKVLSLVPGSKWLINKYKESFNRAALSERENFIKTYVDSLPSNTEAGSKLSGELQDILTAHQGLYDQFAQAGKLRLPGGEPVVGMDFKIPVPTLKDFAAQNIEVAKGKNLQWLKKISENGELTTDEINSLLGGAQFGIGGIFREPVKESVMKDLLSYDASQGTQLAVIRKSADDLFRQTMQQWKDNPVFNQIVNTAAPSLRLPARGTRPNFVKTDRPDQVIDRAFGNLNPQTSEDLLQIKDAISPEAWNMSLARGLENQLAKAMDAGKLNPDKWEVIWREIGPSVEKIAPEVFPRMQTWTDAITKGKDYLPGMLKGHAGALGGMAHGAAEYFGFREAQEHGPTGYAVFAGANLLPMILAHRMLGPQGQGLIRKYAASALDTAGSPVGKLGMAELADQMLPPSQ